MLKKVLIPIRYIWKHPVTKGNKLLGLTRFIKWQIKSRTKPGPHIINWVGNLKLSSRKSMYGSTGCIYVGLPEFNDMSFLLHFLKSDSYFIDIGANVGVYSLLASGIKKCKSTSIEPIPQTFYYLQENVVVNDLENDITCLNIGLAGEKGQLFFTKDKDTINHVTDKKTANTINVEVETLDNIINSSLLNNTLIKLDVEGFEYKVLSGASELLKNENLKAFIVELNGSSTKFGLSDAMVDEVLVNSGFEKYDYDPFRRSLTKIDRFHTEENTLYLRKSQINEIESTLKSAPPITIFNLSI